MRKPKLSRNQSWSETKVERLQKWSGHQSWQETKVGLKPKLGKNQSGTEKMLVGDQSGVETIRAKSKFGQKQTLGEKYK